MNFFYFIYQILVLRSLVSFNKSSCTIINCIHWYCIARIIEGTEIQLTIDNNIIGVLIIDFVNCDPSVCKQIFFYPFIEKQLISFSYKFKLRRECSNNSTKSITFECTLYLIPIPDTGFRKFIRGTSYCQNIFAKHFYRVKRPRANIKKKPTGFPIG